MKSVRRLCAVLLSVLLLLPALALAGEEATPLSDVVYEKPGVTFTANEEVTLERVWVFGENGRQNPTYDLDLQSGAATTQNGNRHEAPARLSINPPAGPVVLHAGAVARCAGDAVTMPETADYIEFWQDETGSQKLVYDCLYETWAGPDHNLYLNAHNTEDGISLYARREIVIYGVTAVTKDGKQIKASSITNRLGEMFSSGGATMLSGSSLKLPGEVGLRMHVNVDCSIGDVPPDEVAKAVILLDKKGKETLTYDFLSESWVDE